MNLVMSLRYNKPFELFKEDCENVFNVPFHDVHFGVLGVTGSGLMVKG